MRGTRSKAIRKKWATLDDNEKSKFRPFTRGILMPYTSYRKFKNSMRGIVIIKPKQDNTGLSISSINLG